MEQTMNTIEAPEMSMLESSWFSRLEEVTRNDLMVCGRGMKMYKLIFPFSYSLYFHYIIFFLGSLSLYLFRLRLPHLSYTRRLLFPDVYYITTYIYSMSFKQCFSPTFAPADNGYYQTFLSLFLVRRNT